MPGRLFWFERVLRAAIGGLMLAMAYRGTEPILYVIGGFLFATGVVGLCPLHALAGTGERATQPVVAADPLIREAGRRTA